jgi:hypothetical protein
LNAAAMPAEGHPAAAETVKGRDERNQEMTSLPPVPKRVRTKEEGKW